MSYVELKHLLADLALKATRSPDDAQWAPLLAAYGTLAEPQRPAVPWTALQEHANHLGARFGWTATTESLVRLLEGHLLENTDRQIAVRPGFVPHLAYLRRHATRLLEVLARLASPAPQNVPDGLRRGAALFNGRLFFECHEYLEAPWRATSGPGKGFYHGIVQVAAAFYHYEKPNLHGARTLLAKGLRRLEPYPAHYLGINLEAFRKALRPWMGEFANVAEETAQRAYPTIEFWGN